MSSRATRTKSATPGLQEVPAGAVVSLTDGMTFAAHRADLEL
jgi:hypothetical protein